MTLPLDPPAIRGAAAEPFVREHQAAVWRYLRLLGASAHDAEDLLQETFLSFLRGSHSFTAPIPLLRTIARGLWIDRHRWLARRRVVEQAADVDAMLAATAPDPDLELWLDALAACRAQLSPRPRRALELAYRERLGRTSIGKELGIAPNTVRNLLAKTREVLARCIEHRMQTGVRS